MTFEQFLAELKPCEDLGIALNEESLIGSHGLLFQGALWIEDLACVPRTFTPGDGGRWHTAIGSAWYRSDDLEVVARPLYEFAMSEGYATATAV